MHELCQWPKLEPGSKLARESDRTQAVHPCVNLIDGLLVKVVVVEAAGILEQLDGRADCDRIRVANLEHAGPHDLAAGQLSSRVGADVGERCLQPCHRARGVAVMECLDVDIDDVRGRVAA